MKRLLSIFLFMFTMATILYAQSLTDRQKHLATHIHLSDPETYEWLEPVTDEQYSEANK